jgi:3-dehydroquinate synthase
MVFENRLISDILWVTLLRVISWKAILKTPLLHGEAIAIGMILESYISKEKKLLTNEEYHEIKYIIKDIFETVNFSQTDIKNCIDLLIFDKKNEFGKVQFALLDGIGAIKINQECDNDLIYNAFEDYQS